ncbi:MAG: thiamine phosphate synthase [Magnetococcales bacterium]|nr:thiamine phosphate synthase [Magnetococcales bacterium]
MIVLSLPRLLLITEPIAHAEAQGLLHRLRRALVGGPCHLLVRLPGWHERAVYDFALALRPIVVPPACLLIHDRPDIALAVGADGVHLPASGLPTDVARRLLGPGCLLGRSCHDPNEANVALAAGADYVTLSPLFATRSHPDAAPLGVSRLTEIVRRVAGPVVALGGITPENVGEAATTGVVGVATIRGVLHAGDPAWAARQCLAAFPDHA